MATETVVIFNKSFRNDKWYIPKKTFLEFCTYYLTKYPQLKDWKDRETVDDYVLLVSRKMNAAGWHHNPGPYNTMKEAVEMHSILNRNLLGLI